MTKRKVITVPLIFIGLMFLVATEGSAALVSINEFLADPPNGLTGDANRDGIRDSSQDEFVEFLSMTDSQIDLSLWSLWDSLQVRHQFVPGTFLPARERIVIFGGGNPSGIPGKVATASTGTLSLNNSGDQILLKNSAGDIVDQILFGSEGNLDQSLTRFPEGNGSFQLHTVVSSGHTPFSPGTDPEGVASGSMAVTPEPATVLLLAAGLLCVRRFWYACH